MQIEIIPLTDFNKLIYIMIRYIFLKNIVHKKSKLLKFIDLSTQKATKTCTVVFMRKEEHIDFKKSN